MPYRIEYKPSAEREFLALPKDVQKRVGPRIEALARDPRPVRLSPRHPQRRSSRTTHALPRHR